MKSSIASSLTLSLCGCLAIASHATAAQVNASPQRDNTASSAPYPLISQSLLPVTAEDEYQKAKAELPEDYYLLYRVVDRLARANALDNHPWRITLSMDYEANAFAQTPNQLSLYGGLVDQLHGDLDALACVVGHEMAHHSERHESLSTAEREAIDQQLREAAIAEAQDEVTNHRPRGTGANMARVLGGIFGGWARVGGAVAGTVLGRGQQNSQAKVEARAEEIYLANRVQQDEQWRELDHQHDFAADQLGYKYAVQAGFKRTGCLRAMNVLEGLDLEKSESHPTTATRSQKLLSAPTQYPTVELTKAGKVQLADSAAPLSYRFTSDPDQLEINSRFNGEEIDSRFPQ